MSSKKCPKCSLTNFADAEGCKRCGAAFSSEVENSIQTNEPTLEVVPKRANGGKIIVWSFVLLVVVSVTLWTVIVDAQRKAERRHAEMIAALEPKCESITNKIEKRRVYDEIDQTDMTEFDLINYRDPHLVEPRLLHEYFILDDYARAHDTTLPRMTFMDRRQILLDEAVKSGEASSEYPTPEELNTLRQCVAYGLH